MRNFLLVFIAIVFVCCCDRAFSFPAPEIRLPTGASSFNISNALTKTIYALFDNQGTIYKQVEEFQQPNLISVRDKSAISFAPKNVFQSKSLTGPFVFPSSKVQIVALISLFTRNEKNTTVPFTFFTASNDALTLQYEYDTKCFGFYWKNRGVQVCSNDHVNAVSVGDYKATLIFASVNRDLISLRIGGMTVENQLANAFNGMDGWLVLGGSPFIASPFFGVVHNLEVYNEILNDTSKLDVNMMYNREYSLTGTWQFWQYEAAYTKDFATLSRYGDKHIRQASSSAQFKIDNINALDSTSDVAATLCVAHNSSDALKWQVDTGFGLMHVLNRHWKVVYVPGSGGSGLVNITVNDLSTVIDSTEYLLSICYKEKQSDKCSLYSATSGSNNTFALVPRSGYYYLTLGTTCSANIDCTNFVKPVNETCQFQCYQHKCYCMPEEVTQVPQAGVVDDTTKSGVWIYPVAVVLSVVVFAAAMGVRQWLKARRAAVLVEHIES